MHNLWQKSAQSQLQTLRPSQPPDFIIFEKYWDMVMTEYTNRGKYYAPLFKVLEHSNIFDSITDRVLPSMDRLGNSEIRDVSDALSKRLMRRMIKARDKARQDKHFYDLHTQSEGLFDEKFSFLFQDQDLPTTPETQETHLKQQTKRNEFIDTPSHPYFDKPNDPLLKSNDINLEAPVFTLHGYLMDSLIEVDTDNEDELLFESLDSKYYFKDAYMRYHLENPQVAKNLAFDTMGISDFLPLNPTPQDLKQSAQMPLYKPKNGQQNSRPSLSELLRVPQMKIQAEPKTFDYLRKEFEIQKIEEASQIIEDFDLAAQKIVQIIALRMHLDGVKLSDPSRLYSYLDHYVEFEDDHPMSQKALPQEATDDLQSQLQTPNIEEREALISLHDDVARKFQMGLSDEALTPEQRDALFSTFDNAVLETYPGEYHGEFDVANLSGFGGTTVKNPDEFFELPGEIKAALDNLIEEQGIPFETLYQDTFSTVPDLDPGDRSFNPPDLNQLDDPQGQTLGEIIAQKYGLSGNGLSSATEKLPFFHNQFKQFTPTDDGYLLEDQIGKGKHSFHNVQDSAEALVSGHYGDISGAYSAVLVSNIGDLLSLHGAQGRIAESQHLLPGLSRNDVLYESLLGPLWGQFVSKIHRHNMGDIPSLRRGRIAGPEGALLASIYAPDRPNPNYIKQVNLQNREKELPEEGPFVGYSNRASTGGSDDAEGMGMGMGSQKSEEVSHAEDVSVYAIRPLSNQLVNYDSYQGNSFKDYVDEHGNPSRFERIPDEYQNQNLPEFSFLNESGFSARQHVAPMEDGDPNLVFTDRNLFDLPDNGWAIENPELPRETLLSSIRKFAHDPEYASALSNRTSSAADTTLKSRQDAWSSLWDSSAEPAAAAEDADTDLGHPLKSPYFGDTLSATRKIDRDFSSKMVSWGGLYMGGGDIETRQFSTTQAMLYEQLSRRGWSAEEIYQNYDIVKPARQLITGVYEDEVDAIRNFDRPEEQLLQERKQIIDNDPSKTMTELGHTHYPPRYTDPDWPEFKKYIHAHFAYWVAKGFSPASGDTPPRPPQHWIEDFETGSTATHASLLQAWGDNPSIQKRIFEQGQVGAETYLSEGYIENPREKLDYDGDFQMPDYLEFAMNLVAPGDILVHDTNDSAKWYYFADYLFQSGIFSKGLAGKIPDDWNVIGQKAALVRKPGTWILDWMRDFSLGTMTIKGEIPRLSDTSDDTSDVPTTSMPFEISNSEFQAKWKPTKGEKKSKRQIKKSKYKAKGRTKYLLGTDQNPNHQWINPMMEARNRYQKVAFENTFEIPGIVNPDGSVNPGKQIEPDVMREVFQKPILLHGSKGTGKSQILNYVATFADSASWVTFFLPHVSAMAGFTVKNYLNERVLVPASDDIKADNYSPYNISPKGQAQMESEWDTAPIEGSAFRIGDTLDESTSEAAGLYGDEIYARRLLERFVMANNEKISEIPIHDLEDLKREFYFSNEDGSITEYQKDLLNKIAAFERVEAAQSGGSQIDRFWYNTGFDDDSDLSNPDVEFSFDKIPRPTEMEIGHAPPKTLLEFIEWALNCQPESNFYSTSLVTRAYRAVIRELQATTEYPVIFIVDDWNVLSIGESNMLDPEAYSDPTKTPKKGKNPRSGYKYLKSRKLALLEPFADPQTFCQNSKRSLLVCASTSSVPHNPTDYATFETTETARKYRDTSFHAVPVLNYSLEEFSKVVNFYHQKELTSSTTLDINQDSSYLGRLYNFTGGRPSELLPALYRGFDTHPMFMNKLKTHQAPGKLQVPS